MTVLSIEPQHSNQHWARIAGHAPVLASTCQDYVAQVAVTSRPSTAEAVDPALRIFAEWFGNVNLFWPHRALEFWLHWFDGDLLSLRAV